MSHDQHGGHGEYTTDTSRVTTIMDHVRPVSDTFTRCLLGVSKNKRKNQVSCAVLHTVCSSVSVPLQRERGKGAHNKGEQKPAV